MPESTVDERDVARRRIIEGLVGEHVVLFIHSASFHAELTVMTELLVKADLDRRTTMGLVRTLGPVVDALAAKGAAEKDRLDADIRAMRDWGTEPPESLSWLT